MSKNDDCMYALPHELSGIGTVCILSNNECNGLGKRCLCHRKHLPETRKALAKAIEKRKKEGESK